MTIWPPTAMTTMIKRIHGWIIRRMGNIREIGKAPISFFDGIAGFYFEDNKGFYSQLGSHPNNSILLPGPMQSIHMTHHALHSIAEGVVPSPSARSV
jgi:hypothetical protein